MGDTITITIMGASEDLVEVEGCEGADEFNCESWSADLVGPDVAEQVHVSAWFCDNGCWQVGVGQVLEDVRLPSWPVTIKGTARS
jgi:hypothetical protein